MRFTRQVVMRWPVLIAGLALIGWGVALVDTTDPSDARALLLGVGCVLVGAGLALVVGHPPDCDCDDNGGADEDTT